jgi:hypothetical protein
MPECHHLLDVRQPPLPHEARMSVPQRQLKPKVRFYRRELTEREIAEFLAGVNRIRERREVVRPVPIETVCHYCGTVVGAASLARARLRHRTITTQPTEKIPC